MPNDVAQFGSVLGIWAHPDDETFLSGGLMFDLARQGNSVQCVVATCGEAGVQDQLRWPADKLAAIRTHELTNALQLLGTNPPILWDYPDGGCADVDIQAPVNDIRDLIISLSPDSIITFAPDGLTGHSDHVTISRWVELALQGIDIKPKLWHAVHSKGHYDGAFMELDTRHNVYFARKDRVFPDESQCYIHELGPETFQKKIAALKIMPSQYEAFFKDMSDDLAKRAFGSEAFILQKT